MNPGAGLRTGAERWHGNRNAQRNTAESVHYSHLLFYLNNRSQAHRAHLHDGLVHRVAEGTIVSREVAFFMVLCMSTGSTI